MSKTNKSGINNIRIINAYISNTNDNINWNSGFEIINE